jgi:hypothetical protein
MITAVAGGDRRERDEATSMNHNYGPPMGRTYVPDVRRRLIGQRT